MEKITQKICNDIVKEYKRDKNVLGILLFGSATKNTFDQYSDVDIYILLKKKVDYSRINFIKNNTRVDIILDTVSEAKSFLKEDKYNVKRNTSHMLAHGEVLYQLGNNLDTIVKEARDNLKLRTKYSHDEILMHKYSIEDFWNDVQRDYKNRNYTLFELDSYLLIQNVIELFLKIKGEFLRQSNETINLINNKDKKLGFYIETFYKTKDLKNRIMTLSKIISHIHKLSNGSLPLRWRIK